MKKEEDIYNEINKNPTLLESLINAKLKTTFPQLDNVGDVPDYLFIENDTLIPIYLEVKRWFLRISDIQQLIKYHIHLKEQKRPFKLVILCEGMDSLRKEILDKLEIRTVLLKDIEIEIRTVLQKDSHIKEHLEVLNFMLYLYFSHTQTKKQKPILLNTH